MNALVWNFVPKFQVFKFSQLQYVYKYLNLEDFTSSKSKKVKYKNINISNHKIYCIG